MAAPTREGNLEAPTRHPLDWKNADFYNEASLFKEMERVFEICHGCRRCVSLCQSFPTLFDLVDESPTLEVDGVAKADYVKVVDHCYLCDLCYMTKCPYVPPHEWNVDFPHLMLRAKAVKYKNGDVKLRDRILTSTDTVGSLAGIPVVAQVVNAVNKIGIARKGLRGRGGYSCRCVAAGIPQQPVAQPSFRAHRSTAQAVPAGINNRQNRAVRHLLHEPQRAGAGRRFRRGVRAQRHPRHSCGTGTLLRHAQAGTGRSGGSAKAKEFNIPVLAKLVDEGWDLTALVPSCVLMFKQELPLMFPDDPDVQKVKEAFFDPFEYLMLRHKEGKLKSDFKQPLGKVAYHAACHQRVQNIGQKTREALSLVPDTTVEIIERCSGHDGTYAVKKEFHESAMKIVMPVVDRVKKAEAQHYGSDCAMAGHHIENGLKDGRAPEHPITLLRKAYAIS